MSDPLLDRYGIPVTFTGSASSSGLGNEQEVLSSTTAASMTDDEQRERRASIRAIMVDPNISPQSKRLSIQSLMDGRRRSSCCGSAAGAAMAYASARAADSSPGSSDSSYPPLPFPGATNSNYNYNNNSLSADLLLHSTSLSKEVQQAISVRMEKNRPLCQHYERNCTIISPCCGVAFGCRICHDECPTLPPPFLLFDDTKMSATAVAAAAALEETERQHQNNKQLATSKYYHRSSSMPSVGSSSVSTLIPTDNQHKIDRFSIAEVICRKCYTRQSSKTNNCIKCHVQFGEYHCNICNLWMPATEGPYHCKDCGICRVGGKENFQHCYNCGMCIDVELIHDHDCNVGKYISNCPVCQDDLFHSRAPWHELPCGHAIHWHCFRDFTTYDFRCPVCKKTADHPERMINTWSNIAIEIALQPIPKELAKVVDIFCIDCEKLDERRKWHFLGVRCRICSGFNTRIERILLTGSDAASFLQEYGDGSPNFFM